MSEQHKCHENTENIGIESKEGERRRLCCNNVGNRSPSLEYEYIPSLEKLDAAFNILFEEVIKIKKSNLWNQQN